MTVWKYVISPRAVEVINDDGTNALVRPGKGLIPLESDWLHDKPLNRTSMDDPGRVGGGHPDTSKAAAKNMKFDSQRYHVLRMLRNGQHLTAAEVSVGLGRSRNQTATRLLELRDADYAEYVLDDDGGVLTRPTDNRGNKGMLHKITPSGRQMLSYLESKNAGK